MKGTLGKDKEYQCQVESKIGDAFEPISPWHVRRETRALHDRISTTATRRLRAALLEWSTL